MFRTRRRRRAIIGLIAAAGALVPAAGLTREQAGAARPSDVVVVVSTAWLADRLDDPSVVVIATGTRESYDAGHVPGARFVGHDDLLGGDHRLAAPASLAARLARAGATDTARVVLYGDRPMETGWLYMALASIGHGDHVSLLDGNVRAWREDGHALSTAAVAPARGRLTVKPAPNVVVDAPWVRDRLEAPGIRVLDVRSPREWEAGRLPGAAPVRWQDLFTDVETYRFKPREAIRALLEGAGVVPSHQVVTYCAIGMRASLMYVAARYAGYDARVYVGSWEDWRRQPGYPIVR